MNSDEGLTKSEYVTHMYTAPSGVIVLIRDVPARVTFRDNTRKIGYQPSVARHLQALIKTALAYSGEQKIIELTYTNTLSLPDADYRFRFQGPGARLYGATIKTWRLVFDRSYNSIKLALKGATGKAISSAMPDVAFFAPSSILLGIRTTDKKHLFDFDYDSSEQSDKALRLLIDTSLWLERKRELPDSITSNYLVIDSLLRAVEELSPGNDGLNVVLERTNGGISTLFNQEKGNLARERRVQLRLQNALQLHPFEIVGRVTRLDESGRVTLRDVAKNSFIERKVVACKFNAGLLPTLLENFGHVIRAIAVEETKPGIKRGQPELLDVVRVDSGDDALHRNH